MLMMDTGFRPDVLTGTPEQDSFCFVFSQNRVLLEEKDGMLSIPRLSQLGPLLNQNHRLSRWFALCL